MESGGEVCSAIGIPDILIKSDRSREKFREKNQMGKIVCESSNAERMPGAAQAMIEGFAADCLSNTF